MKLAIENTLGIISAEIEIEPGQIVEVVGPNASGKTSLAVCAQAVLAREANPLGLSVADAKKSYPHDGADDARVELDGIYADGVDLPPVMWYPQRGTISTASLDTMSHPEAVGLIDFTAKRGTKERLLVLHGALLPDPMTVLEAVREQLATYLPADDLAGAMKMLEERGWEATEAVYSEYATKAKQEWRALTGRNYGVRVAADWRPDGWLADFDHLTIQQAEERVTDARDGLNGLHRVQAVSEAEIERAKVAAETLPGLRRRLEEWEGQRKVQAGEYAALNLDGVKAEYDDLERQLINLRMTIYARHECPHCHGELTIRNGQISIPEDSSESERQIAGLQEKQDSVHERHYGLMQQAKPLTEEIQRIDREINDVRVEITNTERDARHATATTGATDAAALAEAEQAVEDAREVVRLVSAEFNAGKLHQTIVRYTEIAKALGAEGVRAKMLVDGLRKLNAGLAAIAKESGWPLTQVADNGGVSVGDRPVALCSESERWRAGASLQLTLGAITGSKVVVLDRGDILDEPNYDGLTKALRRVAGNTGMAVLLCSTGKIHPSRAPWRQIAIANGRTV